MVFSPLVRTNLLAVTLLHCFLMPQALKQPTRNFASDNNAGVHPEVLEAIARANQGHVAFRPPVGEEVANCTITVPGAKATATPTPRELETEVEVVLEEFR